MNLRTLARRLAPVGLAALALPAIAQRTTLDLSGPGWRLWRDAAAPWADDTLYPPPVDIRALPVNPPTIGWDALESGAGVPASVPGTAEEYLDPGTGSKDDIRGVSWWTRSFVAPAGRRLTLRFESVRLRAEVYVDRRLVGYDLVEGTPFEVDLSGLARAGARHTLAVRITDPGGTYIWADPNAMAWGRYRLPMTHGFGGITGRVTLAATPAVRVADVFVANTPAIRTVDVQAEVDNPGPPVRATRTVTIRDRATGRTVWSSTAGSVAIAGGRTTLKVRAEVPKAKVWDLSHPSLYTCRVTVKTAGGTDSDERAFGFRWFTEAGIGKDATFRLNGRRIVLRSAISWGFWPRNGIYPTPELARRQVRTARELGLNMLNFHRAIGNPIVMDEADRQGLLYYEEPGGYASYTGEGRDPFAAALAREKLLRMVRRDRSHPSLVIVNMINETQRDPGPQERRDIADAHAIDPTRTITYTTGWFTRDQPQPVKLHMRPYDSRLYTSGWMDEHAAPGPEMWLSSFYSGPNGIVKGTGGPIDKIATRREITFWGEEGAISAPDRLEKIHAERARQATPGWDGALYDDWYRQFASLLDRKGLRPFFPTVDSLTTAMGQVPHEFQGRTIENVRMHDVTDGYVINGWESEVMENYSGIVDCYRYPKADPSLLARYNRPVYVAVKPRTQVVQVPDTTVVDFWMVNEANLKGAFTLKISLRSPSGTITAIGAERVVLQGGDRYGQLLFAGAPVTVQGPAGYYTVTATLIDSQGRRRAEGSDRVLAVDWKSARVSGRGAVYDPQGRVQPFLKSLGVQAAEWDGANGPVDWIVVAGGRTSADLPAAPIPASALRTPDNEAGLRATYFRGTGFEAEAASRIEPNLDHPDAVPVPAGVGDTNYSARYEGTLIPPSSGDYVLRATADDGVRVWVNGVKVIDDWREAAPRDVSATVHLEAGVAVPLTVEFFQAAGGTSLRLAWIVPGTKLVDAGALWDRAESGATVVVADYAASWLESLAERKAIRYDGRFEVGTIWLGGQFFVRKHPLFQGLPVNGAMNWPYQEVVRAGRSRYGVLTEGEELVAGAWQSTPMRLGTAVGVVPMGKGRVVFSTLGIVDALGSAEPAAHVARKLMANFLEYASPRAAGVR